MLSKRKQIDTATLSLSDQIAYYLDEAERVAGRAKRGNKSLKGTNVYAENFHDCRTKATRAFREINNQLASFHDPKLDATIAEINRALDLFFTPKTLPATRTELRREIRRLLKTEVELVLESPAIAPPEYLPSEIVSGTRGYVEKVMRQVNRSFQCECYDACGVMIRRLLETLIIEVFEEKGLANNIKDSDNNYLLLIPLVEKLINSPVIHIGRTTKAELPKIAIILNNCAHSRTFNVTPQQLKRHQDNIEIAINELVASWGIRR